MNVGLKFREFLTGAFQVVQDELDQTLSGISGWSLVEHKADGTHNRITAESVELATDETYTSGNIIGEAQYRGSQRWLRGPWFLDPPGRDIHIAFIRPPQLTANTNNYDPPGLDTCIGIEIDIDAARTITGIKARRQQKRLLLIHNTSGFTITFAHASASSDAANRISCPGGADVTLRTNGGAILYYGPNDQTWFFLGVAA